MKTGNRYELARGFGERMTEDEAKLILGLGEEYDRMIVRQAHGRLIKLHHPDQGIVESSRRVCLPREEDKRSKGTATQR